MGYLTFRRSQAWRDSVTLFESAAEKTSKNWLAHRLLANHYLTAGDYRRALWHCQQPEAWGRKDPLMLSTHGRTLYELGVMEPALQKLREAVDLLPDSALARTNLGWVYLDMGRYQEAAEQFEVSAHLLTDQDTVYARRINNANWGIALAQLGRTSEALEKFEAALAREPDRPDLLRESARLLFQLQQVDQARQRLVRVLEITGVDVPAYEMLADSFVRENNLAEAAAIYQALIAAVPQHLDARLRLADLLTQLQQYEPARQLCNGMIDELSTHDTPEAREFLVDVYRKLAANRFAAESPQCQPSGRDGVGDGPPAEQSGIDCGD